MNAEITDQATATAALAKVRDELNSAVTASETAMGNLRAEIVKVRPSGLLTVDEMAEAIDRDRNYVDSVWSSYGDTTKGKQTRVAVPENADGEKARRAYETLHTLSDNQRKTAGHEKTARAERDRVVAIVYGSKLFGPSAIAVAVGVDRNHVLRIARKAGVQPQHRTTSRNQYTTAK